MLPTGSSIIQKRGFTLVEIIVAAMVMVILFGGVFKLFRSGTSILKGGMWVNKAQNQVRNTLTLLRDEIGKASELSQVTYSGVSLDTSIDCKFKFKPGTTDKNFSGTIFKFYQCQTAVNLPGQTFGGSAVLCEVSKRGSQLVMTKKCERGNPDQQMFANRVLLDDLVEIKIEELDAAVGEQMAQARISSRFRPPMLPGKAQRISFTRVSERLI